jgi:hypothetical protein
MPGPVVILRFNEIALRLAGFDDRDRMDGAGFTHAEWAKPRDNALQAKPGTGMSGLARPLALTTIGILVALALAGATWLWAHVGTTLFFETIRTGFIACFG